MGSTVATECPSEQMAALHLLSYQLVTTRLRLIAEGLGLGLIRLCTFPNSSKRRMPQLTACRWIAGSGIPSSRVGGAPGPKGANHNPEPVSIHELSSPQLVHPRAARCAYRCVGIEPTLPRRYRSKALSPAGICPTRLLRGSPGSLFPCGRRTARGCRGRAAPQTRPGTTRSSASRNRPPTRARFAPGTGRRRGP